MNMNATPGKLHWNYFLALDRDLDVVSRYIEFSEPNFKVYSIELAHLLFAAASEVDIVAKLLCKCINSEKKPKNIDQYKEVLLPAIPDLHSTEVFVARYGLILKPWIDWRGTENPIWWRSYNNVKHERDSYFHEATLLNALCALGALLVLTFHLYSRLYAPSPQTLLIPQETTRFMKPKSTLLTMNPNYYYSSVVV